MSNPVKWFAATIWNHIVLCLKNVETGKPAFSAPNFPIFDLENVSSTTKIRTTFPVDVDSADCHFNHVFEYVSAVISQYRKRPRCQLCGCKFRGRWILGSNSTRPTCDWHPFWSCRSKTRTDFGALYIHSGIPDLRHCDKYLGVPSVSDVSRRHYCRLHSISCCCTRYQHTSWNSKFARLYQHGHGHSAHVGAGIRWYFGQRTRLAVKLLFFCAVRCIALPLVLD